MAVPKVVVIGAGFGGLGTASQLGRSKAFDVELIDRNDYHLFSPFLYQVASMIVDPSAIAYPLPRLERRRTSLRVRRAEVDTVDFEARRVLLADGDTVAYDHLVVAPGATTNFYGNEEIERNAFPLKTMSEALTLRNHLVDGLVTARSVAARDEPALRRRLTLVISGGGTTGVEFAGAIADGLASHLPEHVFGDLRRYARIVLVEGGDRLVPGFRDRLARYTEQTLARVGVDVRLGVRVSGFDGHEVALSDGRTIASNTLVWAAGIRPSALVDRIGLARSDSGRIEVDRHLRPREHPDWSVFAIGDAAAVRHRGEELPQVGTPAQEAGHHVAHTIRRLAAGESPQPFRYIPRGSMATVTELTAVAQLGPVSLTGPIGKLAWAAVHVGLLSGTFNRLQVVGDWLYTLSHADTAARNALLERMAEIESPGDL